MGHYGVGHQVWLRIATLAIAQDGKWCYEHQRIAIEFVLRLAALEFLDDAQAEGAALEPIFSEVLVKAMNIDRQDPRDVGQAELASHSVDLIERTARGATAIVGDLPRIVTS